MRIDSNSQIPSPLQGKGRDIRMDILPELEQTNKVNEHHAGERDIQELVNKGNELFAKSDTKVQFSVHKETHQILIKLVDTNTNEVIKEIPPEKMVDLIYNLCEQMGIFIDTKLG